MNFPNLLLSSMTSKVKLHAILKALTPSCSKGTTTFEGAAAPQSTGVGQILGGGNQVYIPRVDPKWIQ